MFDLTLFPLSIEAGREQHELPGLYVATAPKKVMRTRSQDVLVLMMGVTTPSGSASSLTASQQQEMLKRLADTYYKTQGSVTYGLRAVVTRLNDFLLGRNLRAGQEGQRIGSINLAVLHGNTLTIAHGGPTHSFLVNKTRTQHFDDGQGLRGLGLSRQAIPRYYQAEVETNDFLIVSADPPSSWDHALGSAQNLTFDLLRRRLIGQSGVQLQAAVVRFTPGKGLINIWRPAVTAQRSLSQSQLDQRSQAITTTAASPPTQVLQDQAASPDEEKNQVEKSDGDSAGSPAFHPASLETEEHGIEASPTVASTTALPDQPPSPPEYHLVARDDEETSHPRQEGKESASSPLLPPEEKQITKTSDNQLRVAKPQEGIRLPRAVPRVYPDKTSITSTIGHSQDDVSHKTSQPSIRPTALPLSEVFRLRLVSTWEKTGGSRARIAGTLGKVSVKLFPKRAEPLINLSPSVMLMVAIIVPILIGTIGAVVYFQLGRTKRFETLYTQVEQYAAQTNQMTDPVQQMEGWSTVQKMVAEAEKYGSSEGLSAIRHQAMDSLDQLQGIVRLDYRPATSGVFEQGVNITRMLAKLNQVYLLDASQGRILSMTRITSGGYEINDFFNCGAAKAGGAYVGPLIDLAELPVNNALNAEVLGIDAGGNLVYCATNKSGFDSRPLILPDTGWGEIKAIATYNDILYVLDPKANAVYWYSGVQGVYADPPHLYFDEGIPYMADVIDLAVDQEFLYLLHADGKMTVCSSGGVTYATTRCIDPAPYGDSRPGHDPSPLVFPETNFTHIQTTEPPDPSLFILDILNTSIYHLSQRRLNLQRQYLPAYDSDYPVPDWAPTAFAITPNRRALLAFGNEVFFAPLP